MNNLSMERETIISKRIEAIVGLIMLIPVLIGIISFMASFIHGDCNFIALRVYGSWDWQARDDGGVSSSPAPIFLGLLAIASVIILKDSLKYLFTKLPPKSDTRH